MLAKVGDATDWLEALTIGPYSPLPIGGVPFPGTDAGDDLVWSPWPFTLPTPGNVASTAADSGATPEQAAGLGFMTRLVIIGVVLVGGIILVKKL